MLSLLNTAKTGKIKTFVVILFLEVFHDFHLLKKGNRQGDSYQGYAPLNGPDPGRGYLLFMQNQAVRTGFLQMRR